MKKGTLLQKAWVVVLLAGLAAVSMQQGEAASNIVLWDTSAHFGGDVDLATKSGWKQVPTDLLTLETNHLKASSDPGYYGREYSFQGDAVVENPSLTAVFWSAKGRVLIYAKAGASQPDASAGDKNQFGRKIAEFAPQSRDSAGRISRCELVRNAGDEVILQALFSANGSGDSSALFSFGKTEIVEIKPAANMKSISLQGAIEYGVIPSFVGDDLIFSPNEFSSVNALSVPSENMFVGLLQGEENMVVLTWPKGKQQIRLGLDQDQGKRLIRSVDFDNDGQALYLAAISAPGVWHREELKPSYLEKDIAIDWKRPFPAKWKTQLTEAEVRTTFAFREAKGTVWRGVPGSYSYPVWFDGEKAFYHLSKKVPPKGESLLYFLEGQGTPVSVSTPADILKATLGRQMSESILDSAGRKLHTHHRRGGTGVRRACTCGCTEVIQAYFEASQEVAKKSEIQEAIDDMIYFVERHMERIDEYRRFADQTIKFLQTQTGSPSELTSFAEGLQQIVQRIPEEYQLQKENMKSLEYAGQLSRQTIALTAKSSPENLKAYMDLLKAWRAMGGAQDYLVAQCHALTRKLAQEAGYSCVNTPKAVPLAEEVRKRCKQMLRNADGYEIWAEY